MIADLDRVRVLCEGRTVADHPRAWARHQTISDGEHVTAAKLLRSQRLGLVRPTAETEVEVRSLSDYDTALGLDDGLDVDGTVA